MLLIPNKGSKSRQSGCACSEKKVYIVAVPGRIEMRSVMGASGALETLVQLMPSEAHRLRDGALEEVPVSALQRGDHVRPHALGLAVPLVVAVSTALAAQYGLLIRDRSAFERSRSLQAVVFDKTGTLTEGRFGVTDLVTLGTREPDELLALAAALESQSEHPIASGIVEQARARGLAIETPRGFKAIPGKGAEAEIGGHNAASASCSRPPSALP